MTRTNDCIYRLRNAGITLADAQNLRRIAMTLQRWHELECGDGIGCVERDEATDKPFWHDANSGRMTPIADREAGAARRLAAIMAQYPALSAYIQGDPRGAALWILRPGDVPNGEKSESWYTRGIAVYK